MCSKLLFVEAAAAIAQRSVNKSILVSNTQVSPKSNLIERGERRKGKRGEVEFNPPLLSVST